MNEALTEGIKPIAWIKKNGDLSYNGGVIPLVAADQLAAAIAKGREEGLRESRMTSNAKVTDAGPWSASADGRTISSDDFTHDVQLRVTGDFADDVQRKQYADNLVAKLNTPPGSY